MGTNYYAIKNACTCCGRADREHIGKSSVGWSFTFQGTDDIRDFGDWLDNAQSAERIENEYGDDVSLDWLLALIDSKRGGKNNAAFILEESGLHEYIRAWIDQYGNSFLAGDFS